MTDGCVSVPDDLIHDREPEPAQRTAVTLCDSEPSSRVPGDNPGLIGHRTVGTGRHFPAEGSRTAANLTNGAQHRSADGWMVPTAD